MLGGSAGAEATLAAADELLARARQVREAVTNAA
jgi:hypothetical protein